MDQKLVMVELRELFWKPRKYLLYIVLNYHSIRVLGTTFGAHLKILGLNITGYPDEKYNIKW